MEGLKVIFILTALFTSWANAGYKIGTKTSQSKVLAVNYNTMRGSSHVTFNLDNSYDVIIDQVALDYQANGATCVLVSGGPDKKGVDVLVNPTDQAYAQWMGFVVDVTVYGRWRVGAKEKPITEKDIKFKTA